MEDTNRLKRIAWREAATGGLWLGLALSAITLFGYFTRFRLSVSWVTGLLNFVALAGFILAYGRRMAAHYGPALGYSFAQSIAFTLRLMLFAGVIAGLDQFVMQVYVDPEYYREVFDATAEAVGTSVDEGQMESVLHNPIAMAFSGILSMLLYGGLAGVVLAAFLKRPADPSAEPQNPESK